MTVITVGSKYEVYVRSPAPSHMQTLKTLSNPYYKVRGNNIFVKKSSCFVSSCVSLRASFISASVIIASVCIQYIYVCNNISMIKILFPLLLYQIYIAIHVFFCFVKKRQTKAETACFSSISMNLVYWKFPFYIRVLTFITYYIVCRNIFL